MAAIPATMPMTGTNTALASSSSSAPPMTIACILALAAVVLLGPNAQAQLLEKKALSLEAARKMVAAAEAERNHWRGVIAVTSAQPP
jgi:hypothetical protein